MSDIEDLGDHPHRAKVEAMSSYGLPPADIARGLKLTVEELEAGYGEELAGGAIKANARVAESLHRKAVGEGRESVTAAIFWLKTRARWRETSLFEISGPDRGPIETTEHGSLDVAKALLLALSPLMSRNEPERLSISSPQSDEILVQVAVQEQQNKWPWRIGPHGVPQIQAAATCSLPIAGGNERRLPLEVDEDVHQISAGLEHLRVGGAAALRFDHAGGLLA